MKLKPLFIKYSLFYLLQVVLLLTVPKLSQSNMDFFRLAIISLLVLFLFLWGSSKILNSLSISQSRFNAVFFGSMGLRMITTLILIGIYLIMSELINKPGIIFLICVYFVYMGFEIQFILPKLRTDSEKSKNTDDARK